MCGQRAKLATHFCPHEFLGLLLSLAPNILIKTLVSYAGGSIQPGLQNKAALPGLVLDPACLVESCQSFWYWNVPCLK